MAGRPPEKWRFYAVFFLGSHYLADPCCGVRGRARSVGRSLLEGYGSDNPGSKSQGMKQLMAGGGIILLGTTLIPQLSSLF